MLPHHPQSLRSNPVDPAVPSAPAVSFPAHAPFFNTAAATTHPLYGSLSRTIFPPLLPQYTVPLPLCLKTVADFLLLMEAQLDTLAKCYHRWSVNDPCFDFLPEVFAYAVDDHPCMCRKEEWMSRAVVDVLSAAEEQVENKQVVFALYLGILVYCDVPGWWKQRVSGQAEEMGRILGAEMAQVRRGWYRNDGCGVIQQYDRQ
jgi:hypothetical protein